MSLCLAELEKCVKRYLTNVKTYLSFSVPKMDARYSAILARLCATHSE